MSNRWNINIALFMIVNSLVVLANHSDSSGGRPTVTQLPAISESARLLQLISACSLQRPFPSLELSLLPPSTQLPPGAPIITPHSSPTTTIKPSPSTLPTPSPVTNFRPALSMKEFFLSKCMTCHLADETSVRKRLFGTDGTPLEDRIPAIINAFDGKVTTVMNTTMNSIKALLTTEEKDLLEKWISENRKTNKRSAEQHDGLPLSDTTPRPPADDRNKIPPAQSHTSQELDKFGPLPENEKEAHDNLIALTKKTTAQTLADKITAKTAPPILYIGDPVNSGHKEKIRGAIFIGPLIKSNPKELSKSLLKLEELEQQLGPNVKNKEIVIYCGCCFCLDGFERHDSSSTCLSCVNCNACSFILRSYVGYAFFH